MDGFVADDFFIATDEFFRRDVYVKGAVPRSSVATDHYLDSTAWGMLANGPPAERNVRLPHRTVPLEGSTFDALFAALAEGATTLPALAARGELAGLGIEKLRAAMVRLIVAEQVIPMHRATRSVAVSGDDLFCIPSVYNQTMLRRLSSDTPIVMTSTVAGTASSISALEGLAIRMLTEVAAPDREQWVVDLVGRNVLRIRVGDRVLEDHADQRRAILEAVEQLRTRRLAKLVELGILAPR